MPATSQHALYWFVSLVLIVAAVIDGRVLKVPNWLTFPFAAAGLAWSLVPGGVGLLESIVGLALGLAVLLPLYAVGGMGAGDVKLLAGLGAWIGPAFLWNAFVYSVFAGALMALGMIAWSRRPRTHLARMRTIAAEWISIRNPVVLAEIAAQRKPSMCLLPYGIPIAVGSIAYFVAAGLLV